MYAFTPLRKTVDTLQENTQGRGVFTMQYDQKNERDKTFFLKFAGNLLKKGKKSPCFLKINV